MYYNQPRSPDAYHENLLNRAVHLAAIAIERKSSEAALQNSEAKNRALLEGSPICTKIIDLDFNLQYMSTAGITQLKLDNFEPYYGGPFPSKLYPEQWHKPVLEHLERAKSGETTNFECPVHDIEGNELWFDTTCVPAEDEEGQVQYLIVTSVNITERKQAEEEVRKSQERLRLVADALPAYISYIDADRRYQFVNHQYGATFGLEQSEILGKPLWEILGEDVYESLKPRVDAVLTGNHIKFEAIIKDKELGERTLSTESIPDIGRDGTVQGYYTLAVDITERVQAEEELRRYENIVSSSTDMLALMDKDFVYLAANESYAKAFGLTSDKLFGKPATEIFDEEYFNSVIRPAAVRCLAGKKVNFQNWVELPKLGRVYLEVNYYPYLDSNSVIKGFVVNARDITDRNLDQEALQQSEERLELAIRGTSDGLWDWTIESGAEYWSPRFKELLGYEEDEITASIGQSLALLHPDDIQRTQEAMRAHLEDDQPYDIELRLQAKNKDYKWFQSRAQASRDENGKAIRMVGSIRDITERKHFEHALQKLADTSSRKSGESLFESIALELADVLQADYTFIGKFPEEGNEYLRTIAAVANGKRVPNFEYYIADTPNEKCVGAKVCSIQSNVTNQYPNDAILQDIDVQGYIGVSLLGASGDIMGVMAALYRSPIENVDFVESVLQVFSARVGSEIERQQSELHSRKLRDELSHLGRVATIGEMGTGLAHELNQPLAAIANYCFVGQTMLTQSALKESNKLKELFDKMEQQTLRAGAIIKRLRAQVQKTPAARSTVHLCDLVKNVVEMMDSEMKLQEVRLELDIDQFGQEVLIDSIQIQQVLMNLIKNALEAMNEIENNQRMLTIKVSPPVDEIIEISVCDSGKGIAEDQLESVFEAFFTTKQTGLGMGLAICRSIIESHNGRLWAATNPDRGTTFHFTLPS